jgi:hypothetical protein
VDYSIGTMTVTKLTYAPQTASNRLQAAGGRATAVLYFVRLPTNLTLTRLHKRTAPAIVADLQPRVVYSATISFARGTIVADHPRADLTVYDPLVSLRVPFIHRDQRFADGTPLVGFALAPPKRRDEVNVVNVGRIS